MSKTNTVRVRVPGTSANCGAGFDALGLACSIYNDLKLTLTKEEGLTIVTRGEGAANIPTDERNIVWRSVRYLLEKAREDKTYRGARIEMDNNVPLSRGLGSSATAIVGGLKAANVLLNNRFKRHELLEFATDIEGHPDNVAPAIYGGFTVSTVSRHHVDTLSFLPKLRLRLVVAVPDFPLSTRAARQVLPESVSMKDAVYNVSRASMLVASLLRGDAHRIRGAFGDALHQPYRAKLIPGMFDVFRAARKAGALGASLSGAGPCLIAYVQERDEAHEAVGEAMQREFAAHDVNARILQLTLDTKGAHVLHGAG